MEQNALTKKQILFVVSQPYFQWRGSPIRVGFDVQALAEGGCDVDLLVLPFGEEKKIDGVRVIRVASFPCVKSVGIGPSFAKACFDLVMLFKALSLQRKKRYEVVHCVEDTGVIGVVIKVLWGTRFIFEKHSDPSSYRKGVLKNLLMGCYAAVEKACVRNADAVVCTGPGLAEQARSYGTRAPIHCISDIPSSLVEADAAEVEKIRGGWSLEKGDVVAAYVGSFAVYQGVELLFDSFVTAAKKNDRLRLLVIGGTEDEIRDRQEWLKEHGCEGRVMFVGKIAPDRLPSVLAAADILISPRISGVNTPLKILDYLKAGSAILAADTPANRLILSDDTAVFAEPEAGAFAEKLCRLAGDASERERLAAGGRRLIDEDYNYGVFRNRLQEVYEGLDEE